MEHNISRVHRQAKHLPQEARDSQSRDRISSTSVRVLCNDVKTSLSSWYYQGHIP